MRLVLVCGNLPIFCILIWISMQPRYKHGTVDVLEQLFWSLILSTRIPSNAKFIQLRVPRVAFYVFESNARAGMRTRLLSEDVLTLHVLRLHLVSEDVFANEHGYV